MFGSEVAVCWNKSMRGAVVVQDKIKTAKVVMGRAVQLQEHQMMQEREREYNQALDQSMDQQRLQVQQKALPTQNAPQS